MPRRYYAGIKRKNEVSLLYLVYIAYILVVIVYSTITILDIPHTCYMYVLMIHCSLRESYKKAHNNIHNYGEDL